MPSFQIAGSRETRRTPTIRAQQKPPLLVRRSGVRCELPVARWNLFSGGSEFPHSPLFVLPLPEEDLLDPDSEEPLPLSREAAFLYDSLL
ncbi:MAG: hypothetical protein WHT09_05195 [Thermogutta sp.]|jgi:hypothetical protein